MSEPAGAAPLAGEHTREVLTELGYSEAEVENLMTTGAAQATADTQFESPSTEATGE